MASGGPAQDPVRCFPGASASPGRVRASRRRHRVLSFSLSWGVSVVSVRERLERVLPVPVSRFEVVDDFDHDRVPVLSAGTVTLEITGPFVGRRGHESLWDEMEPEELTAALKGFEGQRLRAVDSGEGWLHVGFTDGWIRVVATEWESWVMTLPGVTWMGHGRGAPSGPDGKWAFGDIGP